MHLNWMQQAFKPSRATMLIIPSPGDHSDTAAVVQTYPEFCRAWLEAGQNRLNFAICDLEAKYKRV